MKTTITKEVLLKNGFTQGPPDDSGLSIPFKNGRLYWMECGRFKSFEGYAAISQYDYIYDLQSLQDLLKTK